MKWLRPRPRPRTQADQPTLTQQLRVLADNYEAAGYGDPRPDGKPVPTWLGDIAAELRGLVDGAVL